MQLSVVIVNYNVRYFLELCLKSVYAAIAEIDAEVIVVDNNSSDESCAMVKQLFPKVRLLANKDNVGFSKANNQGVAIAKGEYVCILNPDTVVAEDTFIKLLQFSLSKNKLGIVSCKLIDGAGNFLPESKRNIPTPKIAIKKLLGITKAYYANSIFNTAIAKAPIFVGAFMWLKREVYCKVGGFDEQYFMYGEDIDLSFSVLNAGYNNYYFGQTTVIHFKGESTFKDAVYAKRFYGAMQLFYKKYYQSNFLFDALMGVGLKLIPLLAIFAKEEKIAQRPEKTLYTADLSFKSIIELFEKQEYYYKIHLKSSKFSLGSKSSKSRGEVVFVD